MNGNIINNFRRYLWKVNQFLESFQEWKREKKEELDKKKEERENEIKFKCEEIDFIKEFVKECCEIHDGFSVERSEFYELYKEICDKQRQNPLKELEFSKVMQSIGYSVDQNAFCHLYYFGLRIKE